MRVAFYAPMKAPTSPVPSGDRRIARLLMTAMGAAGHDVDLAARLRTWDGSGDARRQARLRDLGDRLARRLLGRYRGRPAADRPAAWFTYHVYHKAPDWIGPTVSDGLDIPYLIAEASVADEQATGPWALGHAATVAALGRADAVLGLNAKDGPAVLPLLDHPGRLVALPLFLDAAPFAAAAADRGRHRADLGRRFELPADVPWLLTVAMMRIGDKLASYRVLGDALARLGGRPWSLLVVGDGEARPEVEAALAGAGPNVRYAGERAAADLPAICAAADLFVWPAVNEAMGMALLEAQAAGLAVVAGDGGGIPDIVRDGAAGLLAPVGDAAAFADAVGTLLDDPDRRHRLGAAAAAAVARDRDLAGTARRLDDVLRRAAAERRR
jgi:glycosyltransferase involved in cell wall biosynthesis